MSKDKGLDYLLDLDGEILTQENGCWIKIEARELAKATKEFPHRVKYCLTLHDRYGKRLLGFDNAHSIKTRKRGRFTGRCIAYVFESAEQLLSDFFVEVDKLLKEMN
ncbi:MAG: hypothetical protein KAS48_03595 [Gammaproteobacteria bacterium]|nr:hypothetical protein [Gammaproteobacteria bacterium]